MAFVRIFVTKGVGTAPPTIFVMGVAQHGAYDIEF